MPDTTLNRAAVDPTRFEQIQELLSRYPNITDAERAEIIHLLKKGPPIETALLSTIERVRPQLDHFREDNRGHFAIGAKEYVFVAVSLVALVALFAFLWDSGLR
jgi:hypothetical protein